VGGPKGVKGESGPPGPPGGRGIVNNNFTFFIFKFSNDQSDPLCDIPILTDPNNFNPGEAGPEFNFSNFGSMGIQYDSIVFFNVLIGDIRIAQNPDTFQLYVFFEFGAGIRIENFYGFFPGYEIEAAPSIIERDVIPASRFQRLGNFWRVDFDFRNSATYGDYLQLGVIFYINIRWADELNEEV
jgi:hypothetical protein